MNKIKLLFIDADTALAHSVKTNLEQIYEYEVQTVLDGEKSVKMYFVFHPDVVVADIGATEPDGMDTAKEIRKWDATVPILLTVDAADVRNVLEDYKLNADNLIKKPYTPEELDAHIQAILKRSYNSFTVYENRDTILLGKYIFNVDKQILQYKNIVRKLSYRETQILNRLCEKKGSVVLREHLLKEFWKVDNLYSSRSLDVFISKLRKYLSQDTAIKIETIRGKGLLLSVD
ncbi:MAG: response regulator transcription factor [Dysgonamonadaceae bacterium]|jgi:DNA-binding response OmpR family regulator|nr:response regulator transcription factor [Dysgonamonadaceae bacterium]